MGNIYDFSGLDFVNKLKTSKKEKVDNTLMLMMYIRDFNNIPPIERNHWISYHIK